MTNRSACIDPAAAIAMVKTLDTIRRACGGTDASVHLREDGRAELVVVDGGDGRRIARALLGVDDTISHRVYGTAGWECELVPPYGG